ncbi:MAG: radical SAM protein [Thermodesulfobacteriota bacterium]
MTVLMVSELFVSIQGESSFAGLPCAFVRLAGCPLACRWCDTAYARRGGQPRALGDLLAWAAAQNVDLVEVTGGEPLAQAGCPELLAGLCDQGHAVLLETSGALDIAAVDERVHVIMDVKCPSSGMHQRLHRPNLALVAAKDEVKFVVADRADYEYARDLIRVHGLESRCQVLVSTVFGQVEPAEVVAWMLADRLRARFQLQLHKLIWPHRDRGV